MSTRFIIDRLGAQGDGIAHTESGDVFVSYTLRGLRVTGGGVMYRAYVLAVL